jgi:hypothetical protein
LQERNIQGYKKGGNETMTQKYKYIEVVPGQWNITIKDKRSSLGFYILKPSYKTETEAKQALKKMREEP